MMLHILGALLLPLCGWLAGDAIQARTVQHLAALQKCLALLERIRQEEEDRLVNSAEQYDVTLPMDTDCGSYHPITLVTTALRH